MAEALTTGQRAVLRFLVKDGRALRPSQVTPEDYDAGAAVVGRVLSSLQDKGLVESARHNRGNGTTCLVWQATKRGIAASHAAEARHA